MKVLTSKEKAIKDLEGRKINQEVLLFLHEVKPAILLPITGYQGVVLSRYYPTITLVGRNHFLIFNDGTNLLEFVQNHMYSAYDEKSGLHIADFKSNESLGITLGYPPKACESFMHNLKITTQVLKQWREDHPTEKVDARWKMERCKELGMEDIVTVNYHGIKFITLKETVFEDIKWMEENRPVPKQLQTSVSASYKNETGMKIELKLEG